MICKTTNGSYVASSNGVWLPGSYDSERTARYAFRFSDDVLLTLQKKINHRGRLITFDALREAREQSPQTE